ncbi:MAG: hypothetical protein JWN86_1704 [Planctomycetota bacterium]|nr:hypothetical protein [Planctomycetota bacterium]
MPRFRLTVRQLMVAVVVVGLALPWVIHARDAWRGDGNVPWSDSSPSVVAIEIGLDSCIVVTILGVGLVIAGAANRSDGD